MSALLEISNLCFGYRRAGEFFPLHRDLDFRVERGEFVAIQGRSGTGKSTLFYLLAGLLKPESGQVLFDGIDLFKLTSSERALLRNARMGFVFQQFHLLPKATVLENILLPLRYPIEGTPRDLTQAKKRAEALAERLGIQHRLNHRPFELSGGEQQRVAIARAMIPGTDLLLADEPTGNLDPANAESLLQCFRDLHRDGTTIVLITHDEEVAQGIPRACRIQDGQIHDVRVPPKPIVREAPISVTTAPTKPRARISFLSLLSRTFPLAWDNLKLNRMRAFLTLIGVLVGISSVFSMVTFGNYARKKILEGYEDLGVNGLVIRGYPNWQRKATDRVDVLFRFFSWQSDLLKMRTVFPEIRKLSPLLGAWGTTVRYSGRSVTNDVVVLGVNQDYLEIANRHLEIGRPFSQLHVEGRSGVCLIGSEVSRQLFRGESPLNQLIFLSKGEDRTYGCRVLGVLAPQQTNKEWRKPNFDIVLPFTYYQSVNGYWESQIDEFGVQLATGAPLESVARGIKTYFEQKYGVSGRFNVDSDSLLLSQMRKFLSLFSVLLFSIAVVTLSVGGIGIHNMMLVSLAERIQEIGLRKALGATDRTVRLQFLLESSLLASFAGILGIAVGFAAYETTIYIASQLVPKMTFEWVFEPWAFGISVIAMLVVGIASGLLPALKAERLQVIEALRTE